MAITCGRYKHFKGNEYIVYGEVKTYSNEKFVLYKQNYGEQLFWVRPLKMFTDKVSYEGRDDVARFKFLKKINSTELLNDLASILKKQSILILHSETQEKYKITLFDADKKNILISPIGVYSSYLTDSQLAHRMGYDLYSVNNEVVINKTSCSLLDREKFYITVPDISDDEYQTKRIIKEQLNPCSLDLHISDEFFKAKFREIDMTAIMQHSVKPSKLWKKIIPKDINGSKGIRLLPHQTLVTHTLEKISLPEDCAGKVEIKSTYARLSLSVTASDFCNPGWKGYFPLTIKNNSNHIIVLHPNEKMLQLSLIPAQAPIINNYSQKGIFMDDDGTPFRFWRSQTVKHFNSSTDTKHILDFYNNVMSEIKDKSEDVESEQERFQDTFLRYCDKNLHKKGYRDIKDVKEKIKKLWKTYKQKESTLKFFFCKPIKFSSFIVMLLPVVVAAIVELIANNKLSQTIIVWGIISIIFAISIEVFLFFKTPKYYCTFEKYEFNDIYKD